MHTPAFIDATRRAGHGEDGEWGRFGYGPGDNPIFDRMHEAGAIVVGATSTPPAPSGRRSGARVQRGRGPAPRDARARASGFCVYDDPAVAIAWMLEHGVERVAYVDVDVHHGVDPAEIRLPLVSLLGDKQTFTRRTGELTWQNDPIVAATETAYLPRLPHEVQEGWIRVTPSEGES